MIGWYFFKVVKMKRSKERLREIDNYLLANYSTIGGRACADALGEKLSYIYSRLQMQKITRNTPVPIKKESQSKIDILSGKITAKNREIKQLYTLLKKQKKFNIELRAENLRLIMEKRAMKVKYDKNNN
jgi:hypothetical protein